MAVCDLSLYSKTFLKITVSRCILFVCLCAKFERDTSIDVSEIIFYLVVVHVVPTFFYGQDVMSSLKVSMRNRAIWRLYSTLMIQLSVSTFSPTFHPAPSCFSHAGCALCSSLNILQHLLKNTVV